MLTRLPIAFAICLALACCATPSRGDDPPSVAEAPEAKSTAREASQKAVVERNEDDADGDRDEALLTVERIFDSDEFKAKSPGATWLPKDGKHAGKYTTFEPSVDLKRGQDIVLHDPTSGESNVLVSAADLIPGGEGSPLPVDAHAWSQDLSKLLIYTNSQRVWRNNTRGDYWVLDRSARQLRKLGGEGPPASMMFAKLSPSGRHVAFVRGRNLFVEDLVDHSIRQLTHSTSDDVINGTTDWVYEEEFFLRDAFAWSPDGESIAYWQINTKGVERYPLVNYTDAFYPTVKWFAYPKTGQRNPACRVGVVNVSSGDTTWIRLPGNKRDNYIPRMQWAGNSNELLIQQFNRRQNENRVFLADADSGDARIILRETDDAWVDVHDELFWTDDGKHFTWMSDRDGWRHAYLASREGDLRLLTPGVFDVVRLLQIDPSGRVCYFIASPDNATQRYIYRASLDGGAVERITPEVLTGTNDYWMSPDSKWAIHQHSAANQVPKWDLVALPDHSTRRCLEDNAELAEKLEPLELQPVEFFRVDIGQGAELDGWCMKPPDFDPSARYPLLVYVYGEPAGQTVVDRWGGSTLLWHAMLAQRGFVVMSFDNRGTNCPRGRAFRKCVYRQIGVLGPSDQAAALKAVLAERDYLDPERVGIWGWSGGGSSTLHALFKYPDLYRFGIAVAPVPNQRYYDTIYQERYMGLPETNVEGYLAGSPINFAKGLQGDLLLVHGTGDDNCHYQTIEMLIDELVAHDRPFDLMVYPNRSHSISERRNTTLHLRKLMTRFVEEHASSADTIGGAESE